MAQLNLRDLMAGSAPIVDAFAKLILILVKE